MKISKITILKVPDANYTLQISNQFERSFIIQQHELQEQGQTSRPTYSEIQTNRARVQIFGYEFDTLCGSKLHEKSIWLGFRPI